MNPNFRNFALWVIIFLLVEPMGLGKMYSNLRNYLLVWPFGYARK
jgi:branched-chain amino acid transport system permease protein